MRGAGGEEELRAGLVGCGRIAERGYLPALPRAGVTLAAVADIDATRCARIAPDVPHFASAAELVESVPVDLLIVATPSSSHLDDARAAARAGIRALVEKPPAANAEDAAALALLDPPPWIGFNRRFEPKLLELRARRGAGRVELRVLLAIDETSWGAYASVDGPVLDLGSHAVDLATWLSGESASAVRVVAAAPSSMTFDLALRDSHAVITVAHDRSWREHVEVDAPAGRIGSFTAGGTVGRLAGRFGLSGKLSLHDLITSQLRAVADVIGGRQPAQAPASAEDGWQVMAVLDAVGVAARAPGEWHAVAAVGGD